MELQDVLTRNEKKTLSRYATSFEAEYALNEDYGVISLAKTIELGGYIEKEAGEEPTATVYTTYRITDVAVEPIIRDNLQSLFLSRAPTLNNLWQQSASQAEETKQTGLETWHVPTLAICSAQAERVELHDVGGYRYKGINYEDKNFVDAGENWVTDLIKPDWYTELPQRGRAGHDLHKTHCSAKLPPLPREARDALDDFPSGLVLWEADWEREEQYLDPAIIVPVWKDLYSVVYTWDLTELERQVLEKASGGV